MHIFTSHKHAWIYKSMQTFTHTDTLAYRHTYTHAYARTHTEMNRPAAWCRANSLCCQLIASTRQRALSHTQSFFACWPITDPLDSFVELCHGNQTMSSHCRQTHSKLVSNSTYLYFILYSLPQHVESGKQKSACFVVIQVNTTLCPDSKVKYSLCLMIIFIV